MVLATRCVIVLPMKQFWLKSLLLIKWSSQVCSEITKIRRASLKHPYTRKWYRQETPLHENGKSKEARTTNQEAAFGVVIAIFVRFLEFESGTYFLS